MTKTLQQLPRPRPDDQLYEAVLEAGFRQYPERRRNYEKCLAAERQAVLDYLPIKMDIENVSRCNFRCAMCQMRDWPGGKRARDMTFAEFQKLLEEQWGLVEIKLQGMGEPLLGDSFFDMIRFARERHIWVRTSTNAALLHVRDNYRALIDSDVSEVQVSVDGATEETYRRIRQGGSFEQMVENCSLLNEYSRRQKRERTKLWVVVQQDNFEELRLFPSLATRMGFKRLVFSLELTDWGLESWREENARRGCADRLTGDLAAELLSLGREQGVEVAFWFIDEKYDTRRPGTLCPWPFQRAYVSSDMRIVPCCKIGNPAVYDLGDATSLKSEWNAGRYQSFRRMHLTGSLAPLCRSCYRNQS